MFEILIHTLPQEIDELNQTLVSLKRSSFYLSKEDKIKVTVMLNLNLIDWENSKISKDYFISRFNNLKSLTESWSEANFIIEDSNNILGNFSFHRKMYQETNSDFVINIDTDVIFSETLLANLVNSSKVINSDSFIITPEISKLWDNSWDILVNQKYIQLLPSQNYIVEDPYTDVLNNSESYLDEISSFKFAMGWFTLFNKKLLDNIKLPESMGHYGPDDTFIMICADICKSKGLDISQFVLRNEIIRENIVYRSKIYNDFLSVIDRKDEFRQIAQNNFNKEIQIFLNNIK